MCRHRKRSNETRNAGSDFETRLKGGSELGSDCAGSNSNIGMPLIFSESSRSGPWKIEGKPPGTPTMFFELYGFEGVWGLSAAVLVQGSHDPGGGAEWKSTRFGSFRTRQLGRVSVGRAGPLLRLWGG